MQIHKKVVILQTKHNINMEKVNNVFAERLVNARKIRCLSQRELCDRLDGIVSANAIAKYENGKMFPSSTVLVALAKTLEMSPDYFFRPFKISIPSEMWEFRKKAALGTKKVDAIKEIVSFEIEKYAEIEDICDCATPFSLNYKDIRVETEDDARALAIRFRDDLKLGRDPISSPIEMLENKGVRVVEIEFDDKFSGTSAWAGHIPIVVINKNMIPERKRLTLFHEMAHLLLAFADGANKEKLCNVFANEVLIPSNVFRGMLGMSRRDISLIELRSIQREFGISIEAMMAKANQLNIITDSRYQFFYRRINKHQEYKNEVRRSLYCVDEHSDRFNRLVYKALASELITYSKAAALLNESVNNVRERINLV